MPTKTIVEDDCDNQHSLSVSLPNGKVVLLPAGWETVEAFKGPDGEERVWRVTYPDGSEDFFPGYCAIMAPSGLGRDLEDGETYTSDDGGDAWTRYGDHLHVRAGPDPIRPKQDWEVELEEAAAT